MPARPPRPRRPPRSEAKSPTFTVTSLIRTVRAGLETEFSDIWVEGELADFSRPRSGHLYFTLRDERGDTALRAVMWAGEARRLRFAPVDGLRVKARGTLTLYEPRGAFQLRANRLEPVGEGDLRRRFELVKARLEALGLLDPLSKRELPWAPRRVGIVTSRDGAALRDILKILGDRFHVPVLIAHASVQGEVAPGEIVVALRRLAQVEDVEVVIVGRGGGSGDDLWAWNDEAVALAIAEHPVPVITAIGHQTDLTIADLVADRRAATPTEAAMMVSPDREMLRQAVDGLSLRLERAAKAALERRRGELDRKVDRLPDSWRLLDGPKQRLDELSRSLEAQARGEGGRARRRHHALELRLARLHPSDQVAHRRAQLAALDGRLRGWADLEVTRVRASLGERAAALSALSPLDVLGRGFGLVRRADGVGEAEAVITSASQVTPGDNLSVTLREGSLDCLVKRVRSK